MAMIDWSTLREPLDERLFQQMCRDALEALGLQVEPAQASSGTTLLLVFDSTSAVRVECCPRRSSKEDRVIQRLLDRLDRVSGERWDYVVLFTNVSLSDSSRRLLARINDSDHCGVRIGCVAGHDLEKLLACQRKVYRAYFQGRPPRPEGLDCTEIYSANVVCSLGSTTRFLQKDSELRVRISNTGPAPLALELSAGGRPMRRLEVGTFGQETLSIPASELDPSEWSSLEVVPTGGSPASLVVEDRPKRPLVPIDHIYVDPLGWCGQVRAALDEGDFVFLSGGPGSGKSRLLREALDIRERPVWIDLSQGSYGQAFVDHLLSRVFDLDLETVRFFSDGFLVSRLHELGCDEMETQAVLRYVKEDRETVGKRAFSAILARLAAAAFGERVLVIDNVHKLRYLDAELLRSLLASESSGPMVFTARDQEIEDPEVLALLDSGAQRERFVRVVLDELPVSRLIGRFLEEAAANESSRRFLAVLRHAPNMQQFMLSIKSFRARGLIEQQEDGKILVRRGGSEIKMADYRELLSDMLAALGGESQGETLTRVLETAAVYGFSFDLRFLGEALEDEVEPVLELLEEKELIAPEAMDGPDRERYRFDHELTHEIIYGSIPHFRKRRLHRRAIGFIGDPDRYRPGRDDGPLSRHYEVVQDFDRSADHALKSAGFLYRRSGLTEGYAEYGRALELAEKLRLVSDSQATDARSYVLEARALEGIIDAGAAMAGSPALFDQVRKLDTLMTLYPADHPDRRRLEGRVAFYLGRHFNLTAENEKARGYIRAGIERLREAGARAELGEALSRACTLEKNCGRWQEAIRYGEEAVSELQEAGDLDRLASAYGNLGAVHLEAGEPEKTVPLWKQAVDVVDGRGSERATCGVRVNYAYILALVTPEAPEVDRELHRACRLAKRLAMEFDEARARLNLANWTFFHGDDAASTEPELDRAAELIEKHDERYLHHLQVFSRLNMDLASEEEIPDLERQIEELACDWVERQGGLRATGDNRILNMIEYLVKRGSERARKLVSEESGASPERYYEGVVNPYRRGDRFITLY